MVLKLRSLPVSGLSFLGLSAFAIALSGEAAGQSLQDALTLAYQNNPQLLAQRAALRATDEAVPQALSGWRPRVILSGTYGTQSDERSTLSTTTGARSTVPVDLEPRSASMQLSQPIFTGFQTVNGTASAEAQVQAGRARLDSTEQQVLLQTVTAYLDVFRDQNLFDLSANNEQVLRRQLEATNDRFRVGEVTKTDVAQSESRLARAIAARITANGNLISSRASYKRVVGEAAGRLEAPPPIIAVPSGEEQAQRFAVDNSPDLRLAVYTREQAKYDAKVAFGALLPTVSVDVTHSYATETNIVGTRIETTSVIGRLSIPLYQSGSEYSLVRQRRQTESQRVIEIDDARRVLHQSVTRAWESWTTASAEIEARREEARATTVAFEGVSQEAEVGARTVLDVLDAEQEKFTALAAVITAERNQYVAAYTLQQSMGLLTAARIGLPVDLYDPTKHYDNVKFQFVGTGVEKVKQREKDLP